MAVKYKSTNTWKLGNLGTHLIIGLLFFAVVLSSCAPTPEPTSAADVPTKVSTATFAPADTLPPLATPTPLATSTRIPSATATEAAPTNTSTSTMTPTSVPTETSTPTPTVTLTQLPTITLAPSTTQTPTPTPDPAAIKAPQAFELSDLSSPVSVNGVAKASIITKPGASCSIAYYLPSGGRSTAQGLEPMTADADGKCSWSWKIGTKTKTGTGSVKISANELTESFPIVIQ